MLHLSSVAPVRSVPASASPWLECVLLGLGRVESCCRARVWCPPSPVPSYLQLLISDGWSTAAAQLNQGRVSSNVSHPDTSSSRYPSILLSCIKYNFTLMLSVISPHPLSPHCTQTLASVQIAKLSHTSLAPEQTRRSLLHGSVYGRDGKVIAQETAPVASQRGLARG